MARQAQNARCLRQTSASQSAWAIASRGAALRSDNCAIVIALPLATGAGTCGGVSVFTTRADPGPSPCSSARTTLTRATAGGPSSAQDSKIERSSPRGRVRAEDRAPLCGAAASRTRRRSEEHTSELQSRVDLVCRLLLEKKKTNRRRRLAWRTTKPEEGSFTARDS